MAGKDEPTREERLPAGGIFADAQGDLFATCPDLINRMRGEQESAWHEFSQMYWRMITGWARAMGCPAGWEPDIFQEVSIRLWRNLPDFTYDPARGTFRGYLKTTVRWVVLDLMRKRRGEVHFSELEADGDTGDRGFAQQIPDVATTTSMMQDKVFLRALLYQALKQAREGVTTQTATAFERYRLLGEEAETVAADLGMKVQTLYEAARRFRDEHLAPAFIELLHQGGEETGAGAARQLLSVLIEECTRDRDEFCMTLNDAAPEELMGRTDLVLGLLRRHPAPEQPGAWLLVLPRHRDPTQAHWTPLLDDRNLIGRLDGLAVVLPQRGVSGVHAAVFRVAEGWWVRDEGSTNGTLVNGQPLTELRQLRAGDLIIIGEALLVFTCTA